jgi:putative membrane protein
MRYYYGHVRHVSAWHWVFAGITVVLFWAVLLALVILLWRLVAGRSRLTAARGGGRLGWAQPAPPGAPAPTAPQAWQAAPEQVLAERLARGEIDVEEYRQRRDALRGGPQPPA